ncbi:MAG: hypothetical protein OXD34_06950 [bacterium]|nr:hypothetical protein [bacterium]
MSSSPAEPAKAASPPITERICVKPVRYSPVRLHTDENPADHACADIRHYEADLALLNHLLQDLRALLRRAKAGELVLSPYEVRTWEEDGLRRRIVMCDPATLFEGTDVLIVGFLGNRRSTPEAQAIDEFDIDVISEFRQYPGILSYSSTERVPQQWANLVVHQEVGDRDAWRHSAVHIEAAEVLSPVVYDSVRIHNGRLRGGPIGDGRVIVEISKYWDYDSDPMWHAVRTLPGGITSAHPWPARR